MKKAWFVALLFVGFAGALQRDAGAQWIHLNNKDDVRAIHRQGNSLWIGTNGGLLIYDLAGGMFVAEHLLGDDLPSSSIRAIAERGEKTFIGTDGGLVIVEDGRFDMYRSRNDSSLHDIRSIDFGHRGDICIGTYGHGAGMIRGGKLSMVTRADSLLDDRVYAVMQMDDITYYYATSYGVCAFKDSLWWNYRVGAGLPKGEVLDLILTQDYAMYALIAGGGVFYFNGTRGRNISSDGLFMDNEIAAIALEKDQTLWAAGSFGGIKKYHGGMWHSEVEADQETARARWRTAYAHPGSRVYFGSANGLIVSVGNKTMQKIVIPSSLPSNNIRVMAQDSTGRKYFAAAAHLVSMSGQKNDIIIEKLTGPVTAMTVSAQGKFYCSTRWGVFQKSGGRFEEIPLDLGGRVTVISSMACDRSGGLWLGTDRGEVLNYDGSLWLCLGESDELTGGEVTDLDQDGFGAMWALSPASGVSRFDGHSWTKFPREHFGGQSLCDMISV
ncbi:MAG: two-component regulator propeller domain-containing protein, partial [Candidatus Latescibacterota bacterium]